MNAQPIDTQPYLGEVVLWAESPAGPFDTAAIVVGINENNLIDLLVVMPGYYNGEPKLGVRHYQDPDHKAIEQSGQGCWKHAPFGLKIREIVAALGNP